MFSVRLGYSALCGCLFFSCRSPAIGEIFHAQGEMAGEVTSTEALLQTRLTASSGPELDADGDIPGAAGVARFEWSEQSDFADLKNTDWASAVAERDFIVRMRIRELKPDTRYHYRVRLGQTEADAKSGPPRQFKTLPAPESAASVSFCMGSCMNYHAFLHGKPNGGGPVTATEEDKRLGYPSFAAMNQLKPDFFIGTGDIVYYDHPDKTPARSPLAMRKKWHEQFRYPRLVEFLGRTPAFWSKDDHDFRYNDADLGGQKEPSVLTGGQIFREQMPFCLVTDQEKPAYRTHRMNQHLQLWFTEGRDFRSPNKMPDGPEKSLWGKKQRDWLQRTLKESNATWKVIITPTPMVGPDRKGKKDNHTNIGGFRHEADAFFEWAKTEGMVNLLTFCGDRHWQYHSIHPSGVEEFSVGALNDENAIRGEKPGDKNTTDPEGKIRQPYLYPEVTGGFLLVKQVQADGKAQLSLEFHDDLGKSLYRVVKTTP